MIEQEYVEWITKRANEYAAKRAQLWQDYCNSTHLAWKEYQDNITSVSRDYLHSLGKEPEDTEVI